MKIYKYGLDLFDEQVVAMPVGARILSVGMQGTDLCIWAMVDEDASVADRRFRVYGTGHRIDEPGLQYIGTVHDPRNFA